MSNRVTSLAPTYKKLVSAEECKLDWVYGNFAGTTDCYLAVFDQKTDTIAGTAVPKVAPMRIYGDTAFEVNFYGLEFTYGCVVAFISMSDYDGAGSPVVVNATTEFGSITAEGEDFEPVLIWTLSSVTDSDTYTISNHKTLRKVIVTDVSAGADRYAVVVPNENIVTDFDQAPGVQVLPVPADETVVFDFGKDGIPLVDGLHVIIFMSLGNFRAPGDVDWSSISGSVGHTISILSKP